MRRRIDRRAATRGLLWVALVMTAVWVYYNHMIGVRVAPASSSEEASGLTLVDLHGGRLDITEFRGQVVLVNVWASWCTPCRREIPDLADLHAKYRELGLVVLGVNVEDLETPELVRISEQLAIPYPVVRPGEPFTGPFVTPGTIPHTWLIDREGRVRASHSGYASARSMEKACLKLLEEG